MRQTLFVFCLFALLSSSLGAGTSSVKITAGNGVSKLPSVTATRLMMNDGTTRMYLLFAEKAPSGVVLVDATGNEGLSLGDWTTQANTTAVKISFVEGGEENYSLNVHSGAEVIALGGHHFGDDGIRGPFTKLEIKGETVRGTLRAPTVLRASAAASTRRSTPCTSPNQSPARRSRPVRRGKLSSLTLGRCGNMISPAPASTRSTMTRHS